MKKVLMMLLAVANVAAFAAEKAPAKRVLFIGNSYTFFNNLPDTVAALGARDGEKWQVGRYLRGGATFGTHWCDNTGQAENRGVNGMKYDPKRKGALDQLLKQPWDVVVMQANSQEAFFAPEEFQANGQKLIEKVKAAGVKRVLLYQTWARQHIPSQQPGLSAAYAKLAKATGAEVVPVGEAWAAAFKAKPGLKLHNPDKSHPNDRGSYLAACLFYRALAGKSAKGLPFDLPTVKWPSKGKARACYRLDADTADFLQQIADRFETAK